MSVDTLGSVPLARGSSISLARSLGGAEIHRGFDDHAAPDGARGPTTIHLSRAVEPPLPLE